MDSEVLEEVKDMGKVSTVVAMTTVLHTPGPTVSSLAISPTSE